MPPIFFDAAETGDARDAVHTAVELLTDGRLVAFPTETVYGVAASGLHATAVESLLDAKQRPTGQPLALAIPHPDAIRDYCPELPRSAHRLAERCWPGPLTLVLDGNHPDSLIGRLPEAVRRAVMPDGTIGLRVPDHALIQAVLRLMNGPLLLTSANLSGQPDAVTGDDVVQSLGEHLAMVFSDGRVRYAQPSTVVRVADRTVQILRQGVLTESAVRRGASLVVLLVCTGNTCRSPMAQTLLQGGVAERLGCSPGELEQKGVLVLSAGVAAATGVPASSQAVQAMQGRSLDLGQHESRPLTDVLIRFADVILTMTQSHRAAVLSAWPEASGKTFLLRHDQGDVADPIGGSLAIYEQCAEQISQQMPVWLDRLGLDALPLFVQPNGDNP